MIGILSSIIVILAVIILLAFIISVYNSIIRLKNNIERAWANIDVLLKQRNDELPNLVETVKGYARFEKGVLEDLTKARTAVMQAQGAESIGKASAELSGTLKTIFAVAENYPKLQASQNFLALQERISQIENMIADRREFYNDSVNTYNTRIEQFPYMIFARMFNYGRKELFEAAPEEKKVVPVRV